MAAPFSRTLRSLAGERSRAGLAGVALAAVLTGVWFAWIFLGRVSLYEASSAGRLEVDRAVHPVAADVGGRVVSAEALVLGARVEEGDLLVAIDARSLRLEREEALASLEGTEAQLARITVELEARRDALEVARESAAARFDEARARYREEDVAASLAEEEAARIAEVDETGLSELEEMRAIAEAERRRAAADVHRLAIRRAELEEAGLEADRRAAILELERERDLLAGNLVTLRATLDRLDHEIARHEVRAPVSGVIGGVASVRPGSVLVPGERIGDVIPVGELLAVAVFPPDRALGRIRPGQSARLSFPAFPWSRFGTVPATVASVGSEARQGGVQVELSLEASPDTRIPLQHGLPLDVEVEVDRVSPAMLVLRTVGLRLGPTTASTGVPAR